MLNFWRAITDNDKGNKLQERCAVWREAGRKRRLISLSIDKQKDRAEVKTFFALETSPESLCSISYSILGSGEIKITEELFPGEGLPEIPVVGVMLSMDKSFSNLSWYGKGPQENYWDRAVGAKLGIYNGKVSEQFVPYLKPQECGNKTEVRWAAVTNEEGIGLMIKGEPAFEFSALPFTPNELEAASHSYKLPDSNQAVLRIDYRQMGVGGDDSWGARTHTDFTLFANRSYSYSFSLKGIKAVGKE